MANSIFERLQAEAFRKGIPGRTQEARDWFKSKALELTNVRRRDLLKDDRVTRRQRPGAGRMYMFFYDAKHRDTLPYWDAFPLIFMVGPAKGGFYGLNLHYLHPTLRAKLFDKLLETANNKRFDETTKLRISYNILTSVQKFKEFAPCFKHYLSKQVESQMVEVHAPEWPIAAFLPTEQFQKVNKRNVWAKSRKMI